MSLTVQITIHSDSDNPLSDFELGLLQALADQNGAAPAAKAPAAKTTPAAKPAAAKVTPPAAAETEDEDVLGGGEATLEDAVARATALVSSGKTADVKAALAVVGAKRVSELSGAKIQGFLDALDG